MESTGQWSLCASALMKRRRSVTDTVRDDQDITRVKRTAVDTMALVAEPFPWTALPPELQEMALVTLDFVTRAEYAKVSRVECGWLWLADEKTGKKYPRQCPLDYYEQIAALLVGESATSAFRYHWLRIAPINRLQLWLSLRPHALAHFLLPVFESSHVTACWTACIERPPYDDDHDRAMAEFCQQTAIRLLRMWPLSPDVYTDILRGKHEGMEIQGLAEPRDWRSPAAILFTHAMRQREHDVFSHSPSCSDEEDGVEEDLDEEAEPAEGWYENGSNDDDNEQWDDD